MVFTPYLHYKYTGFRIYHPHWDQVKTEDITGMKPYQECFTNKMPIWDPGKRLYIQKRRYIRWQCSPRPVYFVLIFNLSLFLLCCSMSTSKTLKPDLLVTELLTTLDGTLEWCYRILLISPFMPYFKSWLLSIIVKLRATHYELREFASSIAYFYLDCVGTLSMCK